MNVILNFKSKYFDLIFAFVMAIFAFVIILNGYVQLPQRTHEIAALQYLTDINSLGHQSNFAIGTLLHKLIPETYFNLKEFYILQLSFFCLTILAVSLCLSRSFKSSGNGIYVIISIAMIFFSGLTLASNFHLINLSTYMGIGVNLLNLYLSHRSVFYLLVFIGITFYFNKRFILGSVFIVLASFFHPSNGATAFLVLLTYLILSSLCEKQNPRFRERVKGALILLIIPASLLIKLSSLGFDSTDSLISLSSNKEYISAMFYDEIDDFSPIYLLFQQGINPNVLSFFFSISGFLIGLSLIKKTQAFELMVIIFSGVVIYSGGILIEYLYLKHDLLEYPMMFMIHSQFGYRIFCFTGIASFLLLSFFASEIINNHKFKVTTNRILIGNLALIFGLFASVNIIGHDVKLKENLNLILSNSNHLSYSRINLYDDMIESGYGYDHVSSYFIKDCQTPRIFEQDGMQSKFLKSYDRLDARLEITEIIANEKINSLIIPPYFNCFRELLGNKDIFFQEHDDGNFMLGSKKIFDAYLPRMRALNFEYASSHPQSGGSMSKVLRDTYLSLDESQFKKIKDQFPKYQFVLTEQGHALDYRKIYENNLWIIYDLKN